MDTGNINAFLYFSNVVQKKKKLTRIIFPFVSFARVRLLFASQVFFFFSNFVNLYANPFYFFFLVFLVGWSQIFWLNLSWRGSPGICNIGG